jgi:hypothetical protein
MRKPALAAATTAVALAIATPASGQAATHVSISSWHLYTAGDLHKVKPGTTFKACASKPVDDIYAKGSVNHASSGGKFTEKWSIGGVRQTPVHAAWAQSGNFTDYFRLQPGGESGKVKLKLVEAGKTIGSSSVTIKTKHGC